MMGNNDRQQEIAEQALDWKRIRQAADALLEVARKQWHIGDGVGGAVFVEIMKRAAEMGLPIDGRGPGIYKEFVECYDAASLRLAQMKDQVLKLVARDGLACHYCGEELTGRTLEVDHKVSRRDGGSNDLGNLVLACCRCNQRKGAKRYEDFMGEIGREVVP